jgi:hypothetical protein
LIKGISVDVRLHVWRKVADVLSKLAENEELASMMPTLIGISPALLMKIKGEIDIDLDEQMQEKLFTNPIIEPFMMNAHTLISSITSISDDEEYKTHLAESRISPQVAELIQVLNDKLGDDIQFSISQGQVAVVGRIAGEGLGLALKNVTKFVK